MNGRPSLGAWPDGDGVRFHVWAPDKTSVEVVLGDHEPRVIPLTKHPDGTFSALVADLGAGARYRYRVDGRGPFPDPASRFDQIPDIQSESTFLACKLDWNKREREPHVSTLRLY
jgi:1,4-alpha-glucan branching enzyme